MSGKGDIEKSIRRSLDFGCVGVKVCADVVGNNVGVCAGVLGNNVGVDVVRAFVGASKSNHGSFPFVGIVGVFGVSKLLHGSLAFCGIIGVGAGAGVCFTSGKSVGSERALKLSILLLDPLPLPF